MPTSNTRGILGTPIKSLVTMPFARSSLTPCDSSPFGINMIHSALRVLSISAAFLSMPVMALLCAQIARTSADGYLAFLGGRPLPQLTQVWIIGATQNIFFVPVVFIVGTFLWGCSLYLLRRDEPWALTGVLLLTSVGFTISLMLLGTTCLSAALPFMPINTALNPQ